MQSATALSASPLAPALAPATYLSETDTPLPPLQDPFADYRRDWFHLLAELHDMGLRNADVARELRVSDTTVRNWKYGTEPTHSRGEALLALYALIRRRFLRARRAAKVRHVRQCQRNTQEPRKRGRKAGVPQPRPRKRVRNSTGRKVGRPKKSASIRASA